MRKAEGDATGPRKNLLAAASGFSVSHTATQRKQARRSEEKRVTIAQKNSERRGQNRLKTKAGERKNQRKNRPKTRKNRPKIGFSRFRALQVVPGRSWIALERARDGLRTPNGGCLLYTSPSPRDATLSRMPSSA